MLKEDIDRYIELRRAAGFKFSTRGRLLKSFGVFAAKHGDEFVSADRAVEWATIAHSTAQRRNRLLTLRRFALHMRVEDIRHEVPASDALGRDRSIRRPVPYIYTPDEIKQLIGMAAGMGPPNSIRPLTMMTLFGLLAATGLRISEALALDIADLTDDGLIVQQTKFHKSRLVPLHDTARVALEQYLSVRKKTGSFSTSFFVFATGRAPVYGTVAGIFRRLTRSVGLKGGSGREGPRIHDIRHTFVARSLEQCQHDSDAVARHIVALATYLGHTYVGNTYWYLEATPILMKQIAEAGETRYQTGVP
jgi:integrase